MPNLTRIQLSALWLFVFFLLAACGRSPTADTPRLEPNTDALVFGETLELTLQNLSPDTRYTLEWGDGVRDPVMGLTGTTLSYRYSLPDAYEVRLEDADGEAVATANIRVTGDPPGLPDLPAGRWARQEPGDDTVCADGSDYGYYAYPGEVNRLIIDFQGGGACWNDATCANPFRVGSDEGVYLDQAPRLSPGFIYGSQGLYDRDDAANPVRDWHHVHVNYCTGDLHLGDNITTYEGEAGSFEIEHKGAVNTRAALEWVFAQYEAPEAILVTGCSAGAYASVAWLPTIREQYPEARLYQLGDCGAGVITDSFVDDAAERWNVPASLPSPPDTPNDLTADFLPTLYKTVGDAYPNTTITQYNTIQDEVQSFFYTLMGGDPASWSAQMLGSLEQIRANTPSFYSYTSADRAPNAEGTQHCIITRNSFYTLETEGVRFTDWLSDLVRGRDPTTVTAPAPANR